RINPHAAPRFDPNRWYDFLLSARPSVPIVQRPRTWPFQGQNTGSNPVGDATPTRKFTCEVSDRIGFAMRLPPVRFTERRERDASFQKRRDDRSSVRRIVGKDLTP